MGLTPEKTARIGLRQGIAGAVAALVWGPQRCCCRAKRLAYALPKGG
jgi:hypothetical protein